MYKLELIKRRAIRLLYKLNFASIVSKSDLMRLLDWIKLDIFVYIGYCVLHIRLYTVDFLNIYLNPLLFRVRTDSVGSATS